jgi:hypothetical protein
MSARNGFDRIGAMDQPQQDRRNIPDPGFAGDDGTAGPAVSAALSAYDADPEGAHLATLAVLQDSRVLVPVVAVLGEVEYDEQGLAHEKTSDMAAVLMTGQDGRSALLAFTGTASLQAWNPEARPVPVTLRKAALAAIQQEADAVVLDVAGPVLFALEGELLRTIASGAVLVRVGDGWGWAQEG